MGGNKDPATSLTLMVLYNVYDGEFKYGKQQGPGRFTFPDGAVYDGCWTDGDWHGPGPIHMRMEANMKESGRQTSHPSQVEL